MANNYPKPKQNKWRDPFYAYARLSKSGDFTRLYMKRKTNGHKNPFK